MLSFEFNVGMLNVSVFTQRNFLSLMNQLQVLSDHNIYYTGIQQKSVMPLRSFHHRFLNLCAHDHFDMSMRFWFMQNMSRIEWYLWFYNDVSVIPATKISFDIIILYWLVFILEFEYFNDSQMWSWYHISIHSNSEAKHYSILFQYMQIMIFYSSHQTIIVCFFVLLSSVDSCNSNIRWQIMTCLIYQFIFYFLVWIRFSLTFIHTIHT